MADLAQHEHLALLGCAHVPPGWAIDQRDQLKLPLVQRPICVQAIWAVSGIREDQIETYLAQEGITTLTVQPHPTLPMAIPFKGDPYAPLSVGVAFVCLVRLPERVLTRTFRLHLDVVEPRLVHAAVERLVLAHDILWHSYLTEHGPPGSADARCDCVRPLLSRYPQIQRAPNEEEPT